MFQSTYRNTRSAVIFLFFCCQKEAAEVFCFPGIRPSVVRELTPISRDATSLYLLLMKLATDIHHVSGNLFKDLQGQRSKVKVITNFPIMAEAYISTLWRRGSLDLDKRKRYTA